MKRKPNDPGRRMRSGKSDLDLWLMDKKVSDAVRATTITDPYAEYDHDQFDQYRIEDDTMDDYFDEVILKGVDEREPQY